MGYLMYMFLLESQDPDRLLVVLSADSGEEGGGDGGEDAAGTDAIESFDVDDGDSRMLLDVNASS